jgi:hypothetical protein
LFSRFSFPSVSKPVPIASCFKISHLLLFSFLLHIPHRYTLPNSQLRFTKQYFSLHFSIIQPPFFTPYLNISPHIDPNSLCQIMTTIV